MSSAAVKRGYSWQVAFVYVFNLIFGAGVLALPKAFAKAGLILGLLTISVLVLMGYCAATFIIETMAIVNAMIKYQKLLKRGDVCSVNIRDHGIVHRPSAEEEISNNWYVDVDEKTHLVNGPLSSYDSIDVKDDELVFDDEEQQVIAQSTEKRSLSLTRLEITSDELYQITEKIEVGQMADLFFNKFGRIVMYTTISIYFYGALAIYTSGIAKCLTTVVCGDTDIFENDVQLPCATFSHLKIIDLYHCIVGGIAIVLGPFLFFNMSSAKYLQVFTTLFRWFSFSAMLVLALIKINSKKEQSSFQLFNLNGLGGLFGAGLTSFMCQNALPSVLTDVREKTKLKLVVLLDFLAVLICTVFIVLTALFAFGENNLQDVYTLNFSSPTFLKYLLQLFPVFTLSANFPIVGITLRENLRTLFIPDGEKMKQHGFIVRRLIFPLITIIPSIIISYNTFDVGMLVSVSGAYPGALLQYMFPALFVFLARRRARILFGQIVTNKHASMFSHNFWVFLMLFWYVISFAFVTIKFIF